MGAIMEKPCLDCISNSPRVIFLIGPGGVGKSTVGRWVARLSGYMFVDLDDHFCHCIMNIRKYIQTYGYKSYVIQNAFLARRIYRLTKQKKVVFVLSSGFLSTDICQDIINENRQWVALNGHSVLLLPSDKLHIALNIVVKRQLARGFGLEYKAESRKFQIRFDEYMAQGNTKIYSCDEPLVIARSIVRKLCAKNAD